MKTPKQVLIEAKEIVSKGWIQGRAAERADGSYTKSSDEQACRFCMVGAIDRAACGTREVTNWTDSEFKLWSDSLTITHHVVKAEGYQSTPAFNDTPGRTLQDVLQAFDKAIAAADTKLVVAA